MHPFRQSRLARPKNGEGFEMGSRYLGTHEHTMGKTGRASKKSFTLNGGFHGDTMRLYGDTMAISWLLSVAFSSWGWGQLLWLCDKRTKEAGAEKPYFGDLL